MISYVVPMYFEEKFIGVVGMDFDYMFLADQIHQISIYENGFAHLEYNGVVSCTDAHGDLGGSNENSNKYTTGEIAKLTGVSVRTVQYYDARGILVPSELSEGGRRLYTEDDLKRMHIICFLRDAGLPINSIAALFAEKNPK